MAPVTQTFFTAGAENESEDMTVMKNAQIRRTEETVIPQWLMPVFRTQPSISPVDHTNHHTKKAESLSQVTSFFPLTFGGSLMASPATAMPGKHDGEASVSND